MKCNTHLRAEILYLHEEMKKSLSLNVFGCPDGMTVAIRRVARWVNSTLTGAKILRIALLVIDNRNGRTVSARLAKPEDYV
jgi:hypothetical protein